MKNSFSAVCSFSEADYVVSFDEGYSDYMHGKEACVNGLTSAQATAYWDGYNEGQSVADY